MNLKRKAKEELSDAIGKLLSYIINLRGDPQTHYILLTNQQQGLQNVGHCCWLVIQPIGLSKLLGLFVNAMFCIYIVKDSCWVSWHLLQDARNEQFKLVHRWQTQSPLLIAFWGLHSSEQLVSQQVYFAVLANFFALFFQILRTAFSSAALNICSGLPSLSSFDFDFLQRLHDLRPLKLQFWHFEHSHPPSGNSKSAAYWLQFESAVEIESGLYIGCLWNSGIFIPLAFMLANQSSKLDGQNE